MIKRIQILHYRGIKYSDVHLNNFNILTGPNASGKSTFIDVINLLKDIIDKGPQKAIEKRSSRFEELLWRKEGESFEVAAELDIPSEIIQKLKDRNFNLVRYEISVSLDEKKTVAIKSENLFLIKRPPTSSKECPKRQIDIFPQELKEPEYVVYGRKHTPAGWRKLISKSTAGNDYFGSENTDWNIVYRFGPSKSALGRVPEDEEKFPVSMWVNNFFTNGVHILQLDSKTMRMPCRPDLPVDFQTDGSNLPKVIRHLSKENPDSFKRWVKHIQTAIPEIKGIEVVERPEDRFLYINVLHKNGMTLPSWVLSDGTLRLLAETIIAYLPEKNSIYMIEEPENGLHPLAIEILFQSLSSVYGNQIFIATHSPAILRLARTEDLLCFSKTRNGAVDIIPGNEHPRLRDWQKELDLSILHGAGVLQ